MHPSNEHTRHLKGFLSMYGAMIRWKGNKVPFDEEPEKLKEGEYFMMSQLMFENMYNLVRGDETEVATKKMTKKHNEFFEKLSPEVGNIFKDAKSARLLAEQFNGVSQNKPQLAMVRVIKTCTFIYLMFMGV